MNNSRVQSLKFWLSSCFKSDNVSLQPLSGDAGFRCYYRFEQDGILYLAVDSPAATCNNEQFLMVRDLLEAQNIIVPEVLHYEKEQGFLCITDFGDNLLSTQLSEQSVNQYYKKAINIIFQLVAMDINKTELPKYDCHFVQTELKIFSEWLLEKHLEISLTAQESKMLEDVNALLVESAISQPQVVMHRDFHSRNLIVDNNDDLAVIDFQDAVIGPITYDLVSLLRDCYKKWPQATITPLFEYFYCEVNKYKDLAPISKDQWQRWFDLMGLQRHLKASGIFARLNYRDNKPHYMKDIPLTLRYIEEVSANYSELTGLAEFITNRVLPAFTQITKIQRKENA